MKVEINGIQVATTFQDFNDGGGNPGPGSGAGIAYLDESSWIFIGGAQNVAIGDVVRISGSATGGSFAFGNSAATFSLLPSGTYELALYDANTGTNLTVPKSTTLLHRWTFNQAPGSATDGAVLLDDIGGANGVVKGQGARFTGSGLRIPGGLSSSSAAYGDLPNNLISGRTEVTLEGWVSVHGSQASFSRIFDFGASAGQELTGAGPGGGAGTNYLFLSAQVGSGTGQQRLGIAATPATECQMNVNSSTTSGQAFHFAVTVAPGGGGSVLNYWKDGVRLVTDQSCPQTLSILNDVNNWLGRSNFSVDGRLDGTFDEFRIHNRALSQTEVLASRAAGPVPSSVVPQQPTGLAALNTGTTDRINASWFSDSRNGFVGTSAGAIRVTSDGGQTWTSQTTGITTSINAVSQVGSDRFLAGANGVICISRNNGPWTAMSTGTTSVIFTGLSFSSATRGFAVGTGGTICIYNGTTWVAQFTGITTTFNGVSVVAGTNTAWAVGAGGVICFYNGTAWSQISSGVTADFFSVSFLRNNLGFAVGANGLLCRYNGTTWVQVVTGTSVTLRSVAIVDERTIIVSGDGGLVCQSTDGGLTWAFLAAGSSSADLGATAAIEGKVYLFGAGGGGNTFSAPRPPSGLVTVPTGTTARVNASSVNDAGIGLIATAGGGIRRTINGGQTWTGSATGITTEILAVSQVGLDAYFAGANGVICVSRNNGPWTPFVTGTTATFTGLSFSSPTRGFAVGTGGTICIYNGTSWVAQTTNTTVAFSGVSVVANTNTAWAVGAGGVICFYNGSAWSVVSSGTTANFNSVAFLRSNLGFAVGDGGLVCRYNGSTWQPVVTGATVSIRSVVITNENTVVFSGDGGLLCQSTDGGLTWATFSVNSYGDLLAIAPSERGVLVFGAGGAGYGLSTPRLPVGLAGLPTGTSGIINAARFSDSRNGFIATDGGVIRTTVDGGLTWAAQTTSITSPINAVDQVGSDRFFAGANGVICISRNNGPWTTMSTGLPSVIFTGLSFSSPTRGFAVGTGGTICIYNGTSWVAQTTGITAAFNGVSVVRGNSSIAWAVGAGGIICRYNGTAWVEFSSGVTSNFYGVSFLTPNLGYAVGANGLLCRFNGSVWQPVPTGVTVALRSVVIVNEKTLIISGDEGLVCQSTDGGLTWVNLSVGSSARVGTIVQAEGQIYGFGSGGAGIEFSVPRLPTGLITLPTGTTASINSSSFGTTGTGLIATNGGGIRRTSNAGLTWSDSITGITSNILAVSQVGSDAFFAGANGVIRRSLNNGAWTAQTTNTSETFSGLSFSSATRGFAVGTGGTICIYNGTSWVAQTTGTTAAFNGVSVVGGTNNAWAVGSGGIICRYNGSAWVQVSSGVTADFYGVSFLRENLGFAVGANGLLCRYNGTAWQQVSSGATGALRSVVILNENTILVSGDGGLVCQSTDGGFTWEYLSVSATARVTTLAASGGQIYGFGADGVGRRFIAPILPFASSLTTGTTAQIRASSFSDPRKGFFSTNAGVIRATSDGGQTWSAQATGITSSVNAVRQVGSDRFLAGANGVICRSQNNGPWTAMNTGTTSVTFTGLSFSSATRGFAVGTGGTICIYNGTSWVTQTTGITTAFNSVAAVGSSTAWAVGAGGVICRYNGTTWSQVSSGTTADFYSVSFLSENLGFAVGANGLICRYDGANWLPLVSGVTTDIRSLQIVDQNEIIVCGDNGLVLVTFDSGVTWNVVSVGTSMDLFALSISGDEGFAFGTGGAGVRFSATNDNFASWIATYPSVSPGLAGFGQDADGDGVDNGTENFFGTNPGVGSAGLIAGVRSGSTFTITHRQNALPAIGVSGAYRWSKDLVTFRNGGQSDGVTTVSFNAITTAGVTTVTATVTGIVPTRLFVDVKVSQN